jgi:hypothetical protein
MYRGESHTKRTTTTTGRKGKRARGKGGVVMQGKDVQKQKESKSSGDLLCRGEKRK